MNILSVAIMWISIAIALTLLLKAQAQNLAKINAELRDSRKALSENGAHLIELSSRLEDVDAIKDGVLSQMSHELRTPVSAIKAAAVVIQKYGDSKPGTSTNFSGKILQETDRLTGMIENLVGVVRPAMDADRSGSAKDAPIGYQVLADDRT